MSAYEGITVECDDKHFDAIRAQLATQKPNTA